MIALLITALLLVLLMIRVPVSFAIIIAGLTGLVLVDPSSIDGLMQVTPAASVQNISLSAIPMFILMAHFILMSGMVDSLFGAAKTFMGRTPGATGISSVGAGVAFAAVSGSSTASAATLAKTTISQMIKEGYSPRVAGGLVSSVGTLAGMIPPSIVLIFYAITAEQSVDSLLLAGLIPGLLIAAVLLGVMFTSMLKDKGSVPTGQPTPWIEKVRGSVHAIPLLVLFESVVGVIYLGWATATEAAAIGCLVSLALAIGMRRFTTAALMQSLIETVKSSAMIFMIIVGAHVFTHFVTESRITENIVTWISELTIPGLAIMLIVLVFYVVLGFFLDQTAIIALTVPIMLPVIEVLGYDPVWFGVFIILMGEIGLITPPLGLNVFVVAKTAGRDVSEVFRGSAPYAVGMALLGVVFLIWPEIVLWLPQARA